MDEETKETTEQESSETTGSEPANTSGEVTGTPAIDTSEETSSEDVA